MTLPRTRKISISVALALAAIAQTGVAYATQTGPKLSLESATMLSSSSLQSESEAASFVSADRIEGNP
ncbi:secreted protein, partial [gut metagenome]